MTKTFEKYPSYKDSGVEWIGKVPAHWEVEKGKWIFKKEERHVNKDDEVVTCFRDGQVTLRKNRRTEGFTNALKEHGYQGIRRGDLVIHAMDAFAGAIGVSDSDGKSTPVYSVCTPRKKGTVNAHFYAYYLRNLAVSGFIETLARGIRERSTDFRFNDFSILLLPFPSHSEQTAIANFLDDKTAKIDKAIAQKERLIELLKERKQIIIQNAVTKGLDPNAKMKDSGVEWIGEIPEDWKVKRLKYVFNFLKTGTTPPTEISKYFEGNINWYTPKDLNQGIVIESERKVSISAIKERKVALFPGDSILIVGIGATSGKAAYMKVESTFNQQITGLHSLAYNNKYLFYQISSLSNLMLKIAHYTTLPILNNDFLKQFDLTVPPTHLQDEIVVHIEEKSKLIEESIQLHKLQIEKLKEYISVLIDAAVTGKIKVA